MVLSRCGAMPLLVLSTLSLKSSTTLTRCSNHLLSSTDDLCGGAWGNRDLHCLRVEGDTGRVGLVTAVSALGAVVPGVLLRII